ncbi:Ankyrin repeat domain-containing protein 13D [Halotydeus destructor]|nr:Ankyrin repeat domain-containing protein 13D [Halotydeus destructor]
MADKYPLHWSVWHNNLSQLQDSVSKLGTEEHTLEARDPRGRTPLQLAVTLGHIECVRFLLSKNANVNIEDRFGFNVLHETIAHGDAQLVSDVLERRDFQRYTCRTNGVPALLRKLRDTPDFYVEMKWEFTSWVPLVSRMCPSDTYKIYKSGSSVRIDTTLLGFEQSNWQRGSRSFIFKGEKYLEEGAVFMEVDHDLRQVQVESLKLLSPDAPNYVPLLKPPPEVVQARMSSPMTTTYLDTDKINFERSKAGIIGFRSDKTEVINGYECRVFTANNVEVVTKLRTEHLSAEDKARHKEASASRLSAFQSLIGMVETEEKLIDEEVTTEAAAAVASVKNEFNVSKISVEQYFDPSYDLRGRDIGKGREVTTRTQRFKANLWLCDEYPLSLPEQVLPIIDLMAISSSHFAKLRDFITLQLPSGFPVKIEIPLFHVLNARITFGNIFSLEEPVSGVTAIKDDAATACVVDETVFQPSASYSVRGSDATGRQWSVNEDEELVQLAMQQYLMEDEQQGNDSADQVTLWEALRTQQPDADLQRAIQESLAEYHLMTQTEPNAVVAELAALDPHATGCASSEPLNSSSISQPVANGRIPSITASSAILPVTPGQPGAWSSDLEVALRISKQEQDLAERQRLEEEEMLKRILELSMTEK